MKCQNFVNNWKVNENNAPSQIVMVRFSPAVLEFIYEDTLPNVFSSPIAFDTDAASKIQTSIAINNYIKGLLFYFDNPHLIKEELLKLKLRELVFLLSNLNNNKIVKAMLGELFLTKNYKFKEIIQANLYENLNLEGLAFLCGLSLSSFQREFKSIFLTSPAKYIKKKRLERAKILLKNPDTRVSEVAFTVGFESASHFSNAFNAAYNISPSNYQKSIIN